MNKDSKEGRKRRKI